MTGYVALCVRACALNARGFTASMHTGGVWVFCCMCAMLACGSVHAFCVHV